MDNKIKRIFILLFVVGTLLLMMGSVNANAVELDENLEAVVVDDDLSVNDDISIDDELSINDDDSIQDLDDKVSSQLTANDDETSNAIASVDDDLNDIDSKLVVSNEEQTTISAKDSNEDTLTANRYDFRIVKTTSTPSVIVGEDVYFDIFVENLGPGTVGGQITLKDFFNPDELEYVDWHANAWAENYRGGGISYQYGPHFEVNYETWGNWQPGYNLNFTVHYRAKRPGLIQTSTQIYTDWQEYWGNATVIVGSNNFNIIKTAKTPVVKVGDDVYFEIFVQNIGPQAFADWVLTVSDFFNPDELEYIDWNADSYKELYQVDYVTNQYGPHVEVKYITYGNWQPGYTLNFTLHFKAKRDGQLNNSAQIWTPWKEYWAYSSVLAGEPEITIIKTPHQPVYQVGDDVYFDVYMENTGTLPVTHWWINEWTPDFDYMWIDDWYDFDGLEFVDITFNPDKEGNVYPQNYNYAGQISNPETGQPQLLIQYAHYGDWQPGYSLNFTTHFKALKEGQFNNSVHTFWKWKWYGPAEIHRHIEVWGNNSVYVGKPEFTLVKTSNNDTVNVGDMVTFTLNYTNTGIIPLTGVYIKDNEYTNGLVFSDYSDKELWTFDGTDTWYYNSELAPNESAILELTFQATTAGEKNNTAIAGHNITNDTLNSTDTVLVVENETQPPEEPEEEEEPQEEPEEDEPQEEEPEETEPQEEDPVEKETSKGVALKTASIPAAGNPLFVLLISMIALCFVSIRGKK